jgi:hypothetical protein
MEKILERQLQIPIEYSRLTAAFGTIEFAHSKINSLRSILLDPDAVIFMNGSFITGICGNPSNPHFLKPIDQDRISDLDIGIIDFFLFRDIPHREIIANGKSYSLTYKDGRIKEFLKKGVDFNKIFQIINELQNSTGRRADINIFQDVNTWLSLGKNYWLLANYQSICF